MRPCLNPIGPHRVCRRLSLPTRIEPDEQDNEHVSPEVRTRAVRMVLEHGGEYAWRWSAVVSVSQKIGCSAHTLNDWVKKAEVDGGRRAGVPSDVAEKLKALERENRELRQANEPKVRVSEFLRKASAYFAQAELDRPLKR